MRKKYRVLEKRYSDGVVRFFPQVYDWWHGWRYFSNLNSYHSADEPHCWLWGDTLEKAKNWLLKEIELRRTAQAPERRKPVFVTESIEHPVQEE